MNINSCTTSSSSANCRTNLCGLFAETPLLLEKTNREMDESEEIYSVLFVNEILH